MDGEGFEKKMMNEYCEHNDNVEWIDVLIQRANVLEDIEKKATKGEFEEYNVTFGGHVIHKYIYALTRNESKLISEFSGNNEDNDRTFVCALLNDALPLIKDLLKQIELVKVKENAATILLSEMYKQAKENNKERVMLKKRINDALDALDDFMFRIRTPEKVFYAIKTLKGEIEE